MLTHLIVPVVRTSTRVRCYCTHSVLRYCLQSLRLTSRVLPNIIQCEGYPKHWRRRFTLLNLWSQKPWFKQIGSTFHCDKSLRTIVANRVAIHLVVGVKSDCHIISPSSNLFVTQCNTFILLEVPLYISSLLKK